MIYDRLLVALMSMAGASDPKSTDAHIARQVLCEAGTLAGIGIRELAGRCHVGVASVSRFCRNAGLHDYAELQEQLSACSPKLPRVRGDSTSDRARRLSERIAGAVASALASVDERALGRLVADLHTYGRIFLFGLLKGQAAATDLQVDLLCEGVWAQTQTVYAEQLRTIAEATADDLIVIFSCTGTYFDGSRLTEALARVNRPKIWLVCGELHAPEPFISDALMFASAQDSLAHPFQLEAVASLIAQEFAAANTQP